MSSSINNELYLQPNDSFETAFGKLEKSIIDNEEAISVALTDLDGRLSINENDIVGLINNVVYSGINKTITFYHDSSVISTIDATDFIKDGMVSDVSIDTPTDGVHANEPCLIIEFNTDAGKTPIEIMD